MKIYCVGRNYREHARELRNEVPEEPVVFIKPSSALHTDLKEPVAYPKFTKNLHYEAEIVLKVDRPGREIQERDASGHYGAFTLGIDFTARDLQDRLKEKKLPWELSKSFDGSAIVGEWVLFDNGSKDLPIRFSLLLNGNRVQSGNTNDMIFSFDRLVSYISGFFYLEEGDLIFTGTPAGVGPCRSKDVLEGYVDNKMVFASVIK